MIEPRLTSRLGWWPGGIVFGAGPLLVQWFVVSPLKGMPVAGGFVPSMMALILVLAATFGLGTAVIFRLALSSTRRHAPVPTV